MTAKLSPPSEPLRLDNNLHAHRCPNPRCQWVWIHPPVPEDDAAGFQKNEDNHHCPECGTPTFYKYWQVTKEQLDRVLEEQAKRPACPVLPETKFVKCIGFNPFFGPCNAVWEVPKKTQVNRNARARCCPQCYSDEPIPKELIVECKREELSDYFQRRLIHHPVNEALLCHSTPSPSGSAEKD